MILESLYHNLERAHQPGNRNPPCFGPIPRSPASPTQISQDRRSWEAGGPLRERPAPREQTGTTNPTPGSKSTSTDAGHSEPRQKRSKGIQVTTPVINGLISPTGDS